MSQSRHPGTEHLLSLFDYEHLPPALQLVSSQFASLADTLVTNLADGPELSTALRKLVEAKDCAVRQAVIDLKAHGAAKPANTPEPTIKGVSSGWERA